MNQYYVYEWIESRENEFDNETKIELKRIEGPKRLKSREAIEKINNLYSGAAGILESMQGKVTTASFSSEDEAHEHIARLEAQESEGNRKRYVIVTNPRIPTRN